MKAVKIAGIGLGAIVAVALLLLFIGIPVGFLAGLIEGRVADTTGYQLKISGSAKLIVLPSPSIEVRDVSLLNMRGNAQTGVTAESVRVEAPLSSLFGDNRQISEIIIVHPVFRAPLLRQRTAQAARPAAPANSAATKPALRMTIDHFAIHEGTVAFVNEANHVQSQLEQVDLVGSLGVDDLLSVIASARAGSQDIRARIKGKVPHGGTDGSPTQIDFTIDAPGLLQAPLTGLAEVKSAGSLIQVNSVTGTIGPNKFSGWASIDVASKPLVKVDLDFQKLDLGAVQAVGSGSAGAGSPGNIDQPWSSAPISLEGLNFFDAEIHFSAAELNVETFHFAPLAISATINNGVVQAVTSQMGLYGGQAGIGLGIDASGVDQSYAIRAEAAGVRALPLLTDVANFTTLDGIMQVKVDLRAHGISERAIMSSLEGTLDLLFQNGEIRSVNIAQMIRNVASSILSGWQAGQSQKTDFTQLAALFRFDKGQATTDNLQLAGPLVRVTGAGTADIGAKTLKFRLDPKLVMSLEGQGGTANPVGLSVPVVVEGTWGQPKIYPEIAGMLENPDAAFAKLKELGSGLFNSSSNGQPGSTNLMQGLGDIIKNLGNSHPDSQAPVAAGKQ